MLSALSGETAEQRSDADSVHPETLSDCLLAALQAGRLLQTPDERPMQWPPLASKSK